LLETHPFLTKSITSGVIAFLGDIGCQLLLNQFSDDFEAFSWKRSLKFAFLGTILVGPVLHYRYIWDHDEIFLAYFIINVRYKLVSHLFPSSSSHSFPSFKIIFKRLLVGKREFIFSNLFLEKSHNLFQKSIFSYGLLDQGCISPIFLPTFLSCICLLDGF